MKYCSFEYDGNASYGVQGSDGTIIDLRAKLGEQAPADLDALIALIAIDGSLLDQIKLASEGTGGIDPDSVTWLPPVGRPSKIFGVAINNKVGQSFAYRPFENPAFFFKAPSALIGHRQPIVVKESYGLTHPEPEMAVVIGKKCKDVSEADALACVFGYTILNDVTSQALKEHDSIEFITPSSDKGGTKTLMNWRKVRDEEDARSLYYTYHGISKGVDTFGPMGPWLVSADAVDNPNNIGIKSYAGDELVFEDSTANLVFSVQRIIAHASKYFTLMPGDVIHCGTAMKAVEGGKYPMITYWDITKFHDPIRLEYDVLGVQESPISVVED